MAMELKVPRLWLGWLWDRRYMYHSSGSSKLTSPHGWHHDAYYLDSQIYHKFSTTCTATLQYQFTHHGPYIHGHANTALSKKMEQSALT